MSFKNIIKLATERQNEINYKATSTGFPVKLPPPKKETKIKGLQSKHVQAVLEKLHDKKLKRNLKLRAGKCDSSNECISDDSLSNAQKSANNGISSKASIPDSSTNEFNLSNLFTKYDRRVARMESESVPNMLELMNQRGQQRKQQQLEDMQQRDELERKRREERISLNQSSQSADMLITKGDVKIKNVVEIKDSQICIKENEEKKLEDKKLKRQKAEKEAALRLKMGSSARDEILRLKLLDSKTKIKCKKAFQKNLLKRPCFEEDNNTDFKIPKKGTHEIDETKQSLLASRYIESKPMTQEEKERLARKLANNLKHTNNTTLKTLESSELALSRNVKKEKNNDITTHSIKKLNNKDEIIPSKKTSANYQMAANDVATKFKNNSNSSISNIVSNYDHSDKMVNSNTCKNFKDIKIKKINLKSPNIVNGKMNMSSENKLKDELDMKKNKARIELKINESRADLPLDKRKISNESHQNDEKKAKHSISNLDKLKQSGHIKEELSQTKIKDKNFQINNSQNKNPNNISCQENITKKPNASVAVQNKNVKENPYKPVQGQACAWDRINNLKQHSNQQKKRQLNNDSQPVNRKSIGAISGETIDNHKQKLSKDNITYKSNNSSNSPLYEQDYEDDDEEYIEDNLSDFIDDDPVEQFTGFDYSKHIKDIFKYDKKRYLDENDDDDLRSMESSYKQVQKEEIISKRIGRAEDLEDIRQEQLELQRKLKKHKSK